MLSQHFLTANFAFIKSDSGNTNQGFPFGRATRDLDMYFRNHSLQRKVGVSEKSVIKETKLKKTPPGGHFNFALRGDILTLR